MKIYSLYFAWLIACIGMLGSLYFSLALHIEPCPLCWYQRICLYPLTLLLAIALYKSSLEIVPYVFPLVIIGLLLALYHIALQEFGWNLIDICGAGPSCAEKFDTGFGKLSLPVLSAFTFLIIILFLLIAWPKKREIDQ